MSHPQVKLLLPRTNLPEDLRHFLLYIPWDDKYLDYIPGEFQGYFLDCLPLLRTRTTNVHVAVCFQYFDKLISIYEKNHHRSINRLVIGLGLILHDIGWSRLNQSEIAVSLGVSGLKLTVAAENPKEKHVIIGEKIARQFLNKWNISPLESNLICQCIRWHDQPDKIKPKENHQEIYILADLDHLWSFTQLNFWQDVQRKGVDPATYAANLKNDLDNYFITPEGKSIARQLLSARMYEI